MDFLNHGRELLRQAVAEAIRNHVPEQLRIPFALGLLLIGIRCTLDPQYIFRKRLWAQPVESRLESREKHILFTRCVGVLLLIAGGVLLEFK